MAMVVGRVWRTTSSSWTMMLPGVFGGTYTDAKSIGNDIRENLRSFASSASASSSSSAAVVARKPELTLVQAVNEAMHVALDADDRCVVFGEDVGRLGGVFQSTAGLQVRSMHMYMSVYIIRVMCLRSTSTTTQMRSLSLSLCISIDNHRFVLTFDIIDVRVFITVRFFLYMGWLSSRYTHTHIHTQIRRRSSGAVVSSTRRYANRALPDSELDLRRRDFARLPRSSLQTTSSRLLISSSMRQQSTGTCDEPRTCRSPLIGERAHTHNNLLLCSHTEMKRAQ